jgi:hypothetical protein
MTDEIKNALEHDGKKQKASKQPRERDRGSAKKDGSGVKETKGDETARVHQGRS